MSLIMLDVSFGIFAVMTIIAGLVIGMLAARFVYIDRWYERMIEKHETIAEEIIEELENNVDYMKNDGVENNYRDLLEHAFAHKDTIGTYKSRRDNNRHAGVYLDIAIIFTIIIVGLLTVLSIFEINILLVTTLLILVLIPLLHFGLHIRILREESNV